MSDHAVFISYSSKDVVVAKQILEYLEKNGVSCWMAPRNIIPGKHYASSILDAIKTSKAFFLLFSPYSNISEQCLKEVDRAVNAKLPIIPFRIKDHPPTEAMEYYLCNTHWLDAFSRQTGDYFPQLLSTCRRIIAGNVPEIVTPSRPQKKFEEISSGMQEALNKVDHSVAKDERKNFYKKHTKIEKTKPTTINPLVEPTQKNYKIDKFLKDQSNDLTQVDIKKKKIKKKVALKPAVTITKQSKSPTKNKYLAPFLIVLFSSFAIYTSKMMENKKNQKNFKSIKKDVVKNVKEIIDYNYLSTKLLTSDDLSFLNKKMIAEYRALIISKDGNLFKRIGGNLVENSHNRMELNNLAALDTLEHRPKFEILKQFQNSNLDLKKKYPLVFLAPSSAGEDAEVETSWDFHKEILKRLLRDHTIQALSTKEYPSQEDHSREYYISKVTLLVRAKILSSKKQFLEIKYQSNKNKEIIESIVKKYSSKLDFLKSSFKLIEQDQVNKTTTVIEISYSGGLNVKETIEHKEYKHVKILTTKIIAEVSTQIASLK
jgi:hypothetical protein